MPLSTPSNEPAGSIDRIMLLATWTKKLSEEKDSNRPFMISASMGKPTFPISPLVTSAAIDYWNKTLLRSQIARHLLLKGSDAKIRDQITKTLAAIDYGDPRGDFAPRAKIADALTRWYGNKVVIKPEHILFTVGGAGALHSIFSVINKRNPGGIIVTPFPHYSLYTGPQGKNRLFSIPVMENQGYRLTAESLDKYLQAAMAQAEKEHVKVSAFLLCDPNNPLGTALNEEELKKIACVLKKYPDIFIVLDEAYAEMRLGGKHALSLLNVAPKLKDRIILMRSATKALSAAGERMALVVTFNETIKANLLEESVNTYGHAPRSLQYVFAESIDKLDSTELESLRNYYKPQVEYATERLRKMGATMPDPHYQTEGAFYVLADLSDLLGQEIPAEAKRALGRAGKITTDEELIYSLLFENGISVAPLSYFGVSNRRGYVRITCSGGEMELAELMDRLEPRLVAARKTKQTSLEQELTTMLEKLNQFDRVKANQFKETVKQTLFYQTTSKNINAKALKTSNLALKEILSQAKIALSAHDPKVKHQAAVTLQTFFRGNRGRKLAKERKNEMDTKWRDCVNMHGSSDKIRRPLYSLFPSERLEFKPWVDYLKKNKTQTGSEEKAASRSVSSITPRSRL